jgi:hypothetical protein
MPTAEFAKMKGPIAPRSVSEDAHCIAMSVGACGAWVWHFSDLTLCRMSASRQQQPLNKNASIFTTAGLLTDQSKLANRGHGKAKGI